jgi:hypothetical protein
VKAPACGREGVACLGLAEGDLYLQVVDLGADLLFVRGRELLRLLDVRLERVERLVQFLLAALDPIVDMILGAPQGRFERVGARVEFIELGVNGFPDLSDPGDSFLLRLRRELTPK